MRLKEMRERVKSIIAHKSEAQNFEDDIDRHLNEAAVEVWSFRPWSFTERHVDLDVLPDIVGSSTKLAQLVNDSRYVETQAVADLWPDRNDQVTPERSWVGQVFSVHGRDYPILDLQVEGSDDAIILAEPVRLQDGDASVDVDDWTLKFVHLTLPMDCAEILFVGELDTPINGRTPTKAGGLPARRAEELRLSHDITGQPTCYLPESPLEVPPAGITVLTRNQEAGTVATDSFGFVTRRFYEITWAFAVGGRIGPLAEPATVEVYDEGQRSSIDVSCTSIDGITKAQTDAPDYPNRPTPLAYEGLRKVFFFNSNIDRETGERNGLPCWRVITARDATTTETQGDGYPLQIRDITPGVTITQPHQVNPGNPRLPHEPEGIHQRIRLHPRPTSSAKSYPEEVVSVSRRAPAIELFKLRVRYRARCRDFVEDPDTPPFPMEFHLPIVQKAASAMLRELGDPALADDYEDRADKKISSLVARHVTPTDTSYARGQWGSSPAVWPPPISGFRRA